MSLSWFFVARFIHVMYTFYLRKKNKCFRGYCFYEIIFFYIFYCFHRFSCNQPTFNLDPTVALMWNGNIGSLKCFDEALKRKQNALKLETTPLFFYIFVEGNAMKPLNSGHLRVSKKLSVIERCPLLGGNFKKIVTYGTQRFVRYSWHVHYLGCPLLGGFTIIYLFNRI